MRKLFVSAGLLCCLFTVGLAQETKGKHFSCLLDSFEPTFKLSPCNYDSEESIPDFQLRFSSTHPFAKALENLRVGVSTAEFIEYPGKLCLERVQPLGGLTQRSVDRLDICVSTRRVKKRD
jgi:hypothetical protein